MFFDRLDADPDAPAIDADATGLYQNRNRAYAPAIGRFLQQDPNETGQLLLQAHANQGAALAAQVQVFSLDGLYGDGMNLFAYLGNNPVNRRDPSGLFDYFAEADAIVADIAATRAANVAQVEGALNGAVQIASVLGPVLFSVLPGADAIILAAKLAKGEEVSFGDLVAAGVSVGGAALVVKAIGKTFTKIKGLNKGRKALKATGCNCFVAGTLIATPAGPIPIQDLAVGDEVATRHHYDPPSNISRGSVTRLFRDVAPAILWLTLGNGVSLGLTPEHQVWSPSVGWTEARALAPGDTLLGLDGAALTIVDSCLDPTPAPIYNLEVYGTYTYYANGVWVHNNSCTILHHIATNKNWLRHPKWSQKFEKLFAKGGMTLDDAANLLELPASAHSGPHSQGYHRMVYDALREAISRKSGQEAAREAIETALARLAQKIRDNPGLLRQ